VLSGLRCADLGPGRLFAERDPIVRDARDLPEVRWRRQSTSNPGNRESLTGRALPGVAVVARLSQRAARHTAR